MSKEICCFDCVHIIILLIGIAAYHALPYLSAMAIVLELVDVSLNAPSGLFWSWGVVSELANERREGARTCHVIPPSLYSGASLLCYSFLANRQSPE